MNNHEKVIYKKISNIFNVAESGVRTFKWSTLKSEDLDSSTRIYRELCYEENVQPRPMSNVKIVSEFNKRHIYSHNIPWNCYSKEGVEVTTKDVRGGTVQKHVIKPYKKSEVKVAGTWLKYVKTYQKGLKVKRTIDAGKSSTKEINPVNFYHSAVFGSMLACPAVESIIGLRKEALSVKVRMSQELRFEICDIIKEVRENRIMFSKPRRGLKEFMYKCPDTTKVYLKFLELVYSLVFMIKDKEECTPENIVKMIECLNFDNNSMQPGYVVCAPPGSGKTLMRVASGLGYLEIDFMDLNKIRAHPERVEKYCKRGFSFVSHEWDFKKWKAVKLILIPESMIDHASYLDTTHHFLDQIKDQKKKFYRTKVKDRNVKQDTRKTQPFIRFDKAHKDRAMYYEAFSNDGISEECNGEVFQNGASVVDGLLSVLQLTYNALCE